MSKIKLFTILLINSILISCSSDSDNTKIQQYFNFTKDGQQVLITQWDTNNYPDEEGFEVVGKNTTGGNISVSFDKYGSLNRVRLIEPNGSDFSTKNNFYDFSSNYFKFELIAIDEINKTVKVNFSGKLYENEFDLNSKYSIVSGSFYLVVDNLFYTSEKGVYAKFNGKDWHSVKANQNSTWLGDDVILKIASDDEYEIAIYFNSLDTQTGQYAFNSTSTNNKVVLSKYDILTNKYIKYICDGTLNINSNYQSVIQGTFNLTATDPINNTHIQVTNATFKNFYRIGF